MGFLSDGKKTEKEFSKIFGDKVSFSTESQDINEHWDLKVTFKVDVKGLKKRLRSDDAPDESIHWVELKNVNGDNGWLYGEADYFAFETEDYWVMVEKNKLQQLIDKKLVRDLTIIPIPYRLYGRKGRNDELTLVKTIDLMFIADKLILKS